MDRKHVVLERTRELLGGRMEEVLHTVRTDRAMLRGWEEPAHIRCVLRRSIREGSQTPTGDGAVLVQEMEFARTAGEPDRGQQRECLGQILEAGACALESMLHQHHPDLNASERLGLECILLLYARPALLLSQGQLGSVPSLWHVLESHREDIQMVQRGVGRLELMGHPECDWAGTACLVNETTVMTTRSIAQMCCENQGQIWNFRPGISAWMDFGCENEAMGNAGCRVRGIIGVHDKYDLALLEVEPSHQANPLVLGTCPSGDLAGRPIYMIGFPVHDSRRGEPETLCRIFRDTFGVKRVQPGHVCGSFRFGEVELLSHDCCSLGQWNGACIVDLETHQVIGMHLHNRFMQTGTAVPLFVLRDDPLMRRAGVTFSNTTRSDLGRMAQQLERLSRTRFWPDLCRTIETFYQKVCPTGQNR